MPDPAMVPLYVDPGVGYLLVQTMAAAIFGALFRFRRELRRALRRLAARERRDG